MTWRHCLGTLGPAVAPPHYAVTLAAAGEVLRGSRLARVIEGAAGAALVGLGVTVATEAR